jgi:Putative Ig domain
MFRLGRRFNLPLFTTLALLLSILAPISFTQATAAPALVTCVNLQTGKERISHTGSCRNTQEAQANWRKNSIDSAIASGPSAKVITICSNKESSPVSYQVIRAKCAKHQVTTIFSRSGTLPAKPVIAEAVSFDYNSASLKLAADPATNADAPIAFYTITSSTVDTRTPIVTQSQRVYYWKDLSIAINALQASTRYTFTISATTADGTSPVSISSIPVTTPAYVPPASTSNSSAPILPAPAFSLSASAETKTVNTAITGYTINSTGGTIASYAISPAAPAGTTFNTGTGLLSGTPTATQSATAYTITATNASGTSTATFTLTVTSSAPSFTFSSTSETRFRGFAIAGYTITSTGAPITSYSLVGTLPAGLSFSTSTGQITGTPTETRTATTYTVIGASASGETSTATYALRVNGDIGDTGPGGGKIFYYLAAGFNCGPTRASTCKYLEAAPSGWNTGADPAISWATNINGNQTTAVPAGGAALNGIGNGYKNSEDIVAQTGNVAASSAAVAARAYRGNGLTDWYLPTSDEVQALYNQRTTVGGLGTDFYWSSRQTGTNLASVQRFSDGAGGSGDKSFASLVRPIRAF